MNLDSRAFDLVAMSRARTSSNPPRPIKSAAEMKASQAAMIREIADALAAEGYRTLDAQAEILGLCRSTVWTILKADHKSTGLSVKVISRILANPNLPSSVRRKVLDYIVDKASGRFGHSAKVRQKFITALSAYRIAEDQKLRGRAVASQSNHPRGRASAHDSEHAEPHRKAPRIRRVV